MNAVKFLNSHRRTFDSYPGCNGCEWKDKSCHGYVTYSPFSTTQHVRGNGTKDVEQKER